MDSDDYASLRCSLYSQGFYPVNATVERTTLSEPDDFRSEIYYQACRMAYRALEDKKLTGEKFRKVDLRLELDFHG